MSSSRACSASWRLSRSSAPHHLTPLSHFSPLFSPSTFSSSSLRRCYSSVTTRRSIHQYPAVRAATYRSSSPLHPRASLSLPVNLTQIRTMASEGTKIKVKNPVVELDGDEVCQLERKQEAKAGQGGKEDATEELDCFLCLLFCMCSSAVIRGELRVKAAIMICRPRCPSPLHNHMASDIGLTETAFCNNLDDQNHMAIHQRKGMSTDPRPNGRGLITAATSTCL